MRLGGQEMSMDLLPTLKSGTERFLRLHIPPSTPGTVMRRSPDSTHAISYWREQASSYLVGHLHDTQPETVRALLSIMIT